jgi:hypothetical protein
MVGIRRTELAQPTTAAEILVLIREAVNDKILDLEISKTEIVGSDGLFYITLPNGVDRRGRADFVNFEISVKEF